MGDGTRSQGTEVTKVRGSSPNPMHVRGEGRVVPASQPGQVDTLSGRGSTASLEATGGGLVPRRLLGRKECMARCVYVVCMCVLREVLEGVGGSVLKCCL